MKRVAILKHPPRSCRWTNRRGSRKNQGSSDLRRRFPFWTREMYGWEMAYGFAESWNLFTVQKSDLERHWGDVSKALVKKVLTAGGSIQTIYPASWNDRLVPKPRNRSGEILVNWKSTSAPFRFLYGKKLLMALKQQLLMESSPLKDKTRLEKSTILDYWRYTWRIAGYFRLLIWACSCSCYKRNRDTWTTAI